MSTSAKPTARSRPVGVRAGDGVLAVALTVAAAVVGQQYHPAGWPPFDLLAYVLSALVSLPLALRGIAPSSVLASSCLAFAVYLTAGYQPSLNFWCPAIALYSVAGPPLHAGVRSRCRADRRGHLLQRPGRP